MPFTVLVNLLQKVTIQLNLIQAAANLKKIKRLIMLFTALALDAVKEENAEDFPKKNNVIDASYTLGTGLPLREVKEGKDAGYRSKLLGSVHQVEFLVTPKYQGIKVNIKV